MGRYTIISVILLALCGASARAADPAKYKATAVEVIRKGDQILCSLKIEELASDGKAKTLSAPRLLFNQGQTTQFMIGSERPTTQAIESLKANAIRVAPSAPRRETTQASAPARPTYLESGLKVDVISAKGQDNVWIVTVILENGVVVWADAQNIPIAAEPAVRQ